MQNQKTRGSLFHEKVINTQIYPSVTSGKPMVEFILRCDNFLKSILMRFQNFSTGMYWHLSPEPIHLRQSNRSSIGPYCTQMLADFFFWVGMDKGPDVRAQTRFAFKKGLWKERPRTSGLGLFQNHFSSPATHDHYVITRGPRQLD